MRRAGRTGNRTGGRTAVATMIATLVVALAGCGTSPAGGQANAGKAGTSTARKAADEAKLRKFAQCMRQQGIDMPDPQSDGEGRIEITRPRGKRADSTAEENKFKNAMGKCRTYMPNGGQPPKLSPEDAEKMRKFAQCMRQHGVDMPDPEPDGTVKFRGPEKRLGKDDTKFKEAANACKQFSPGMIRGRK